MLDSNLEEYTNTVSYLKLQLKNKNLSDDMATIRAKR